MQRKCKTHEGNFCDLLYLNSTSEIHFICQDCKIQKKIQDHEVILIQNLMDSNNDNMFFQYPVLKDQNIMHSFIRLHEEADLMIDQITQFYDSLLDKLHKLLNQTFDSQKLKIQLILEMKAKSKDIYINIAEIFALKCAVASESPYSESTLHSLLMNHMSKSAKNTTLMEDIVKKLESAYKQFQIPSLENVDICIQQLLTEISFFNSSSSPQSAIRTPKMNRSNISTQNKEWQTIKQEQQTHYQLDLTGQKLNDQNIENSLVNLSRFPQLIFLELNLQSNQLSEFGAISIGSQLGSLNQLEILDLNLWDNNLGNNGIGFLSAGLKSLKKLTNMKLNFNKNKISFNGMIPLSNLLSDFSQLRFLNLQLLWNDLGDDGVEVLMNGLSNLTSLTSLTLQLSDTLIEFKGVEFISKGVQCLQNLNQLELDICGNKENLQDFIWFCSDLKRLQSVSLALNLKPIDHKMTVELFQQLDLLKNLTSFKLDLSFYTFALQDIKLFSSQLSSLKQIKSLELSFQKSKLNTQLTSSLFSGISKLTQLKSLSLLLDNTNIDNSSIEQLSQLLFQLKNVNKLILNLQNNLVKDKGIEPLITFLSQVTIQADFQIRLNKNEIDSEQIGILNQLLEQINQRQSQ